MITFIDSFIKELEQESIGTRKMLSRVPADKSDWKPHTKSMKLKDLATHVADIPLWIKLVLDSDELDFEKTPYNPKDCNGGEELVAYFDENIKKAIAELKKNQDAILEKTWIMRSGPAIYMEQSKLESIRHSYSQMVHHRAQLGVYLRLLDIPIPGVYGPSADEMQMAEM